LPEGVIVYVYDFTKEHLSKLHVNLLDREKGLQDLMAAQVPIRDRKP
jgi:hypothetical protein